MADEGISIDDKELQGFLSNIVGNLDNVAEHIIDDLAELTLDEMKNNYSISEYEEGTYMDFIKKGSNFDKTVSMEGPQAWYTEFGTGTEGANDPHKLKGKFNLKPYNSGPTIREATEEVSQKALEKDGIRIPVGGDYWTYKGNDGIVHYTQGIPPQNIVYNSAQTMFDKIPESITKNLGGMFK